METTKESKKTNITFEYENKEQTSILVKRENKTIGRIWSKNNSGDTPYPNNNNHNSENSVQICGFDKMSEIWQCGPFTGKKDCVIHFRPLDDDWYKEQLEKYDKYVQNFYTIESKEITRPNSKKFIHNKIEKTRDLSKLKSFNEWVEHCLDIEQTDQISEKKGEQ
jgi:hypothetical protein